MRSTVQRVGFAVGFLSLVLSNVVILRANRQLNEVVENLRSLVVLQKGARVPELRAKSLDGKEVVLRYGADVRRTLFLVYTPGCPGCEQNWPSWSSVIDAMKGSRVRVVAVDMPGLSRPDYISAHGLDRVLIVSKIDPATAIAYRFGLTPQTLLVGADGKVEESWIGLLDRNAVQRLKEIAESSRD